MRTAPQHGMVSLARALSKLGAASRTVGEGWITAGQVSVDGVVIRNPKKRVRLGTAKITYAGTPVVKSAWRFVVFNKPCGVTTTKRDELGRQTIYHLLPADMQDLVAVGRLDRDTSGLLCLTSDTRLANWMCDPNSAIDRVYQVTTAGLFSEEARLRLLAGIDDKGERLLANAVSITAPSKTESQVTITLRQGKNREVRRLCAAVGCEVVHLHRVSYGALVLGTLASSASREISQRELRAAFASAPACQ